MLLLSFAVVAGHHWYHANRLTPGNTPKRPAVGSSGDESTPNFGFLSELAVDGTTVTVEWSATYESAGSQLSNGGIHFGYEVRVVSGIHPGLKIVRPGWQHKGRVTIDATPKRLQEVFQAIERDLTQWFSYMKQDADLFSKSGLVREQFGPVYWLGALNRDGQRIGPWRLGDPIKVIEQGWYHDGVRVGKWEEFDNDLRGNNALIATHHLGWPEGEPKPGEPGYKYADRLTQHRFSVHPYED